MRYSLIIMELMAYKAKQSHIHFSTFKRENEFYEMFILLSVKVAQAFFSERHYKTIEEGVIINN